jgi:internalin A
MNSGWLTTFFLLSCLSLGVSNPLFADEAAALESLKEFGVKFAVDDTRPNAPVIRIALKGAKVTDAAAARLAEFPELQSVDLTGAKITDAAIGSLKDSQQLQTLVLEETALTGEGLAELRDLPKLQQLTISIEMFTDRGMQAVSSLKKLDRLVIGGRTPRRMTLAGFKDLWQLEQLKTLTIYDVNLGDVYHEIARLPSLQRLQINFVGSLSKSEWKGIRKLTKLSYLTINRAEFEDPTLPGIEMFQNLISLALMKTNVGNDALTEIKELTKLRALVLDGTRVTDAGFKELPATMELRALHLNTTMITDAGFENLADLKQLRMLQVRQTSVTAPALQQLQQKLPQLRIER